MYSIFNLNNSVVQPNLHFVPTSAKATTTTTIASVMECTQLYQIETPFHIAYKSTHTCHVS